MISFGPDNPLLRYRARILEAFVGAQHTVFIAHGYGLRRIWNVCEL